MSDPVKNRSRAVVPAIAALVLLVAAVALYWASDTRMPPAAWMANVDAAPENPPLTETDKPLAPAKPASSTAAPTPSPAPSPAPPPQPLPPIDSPLQAQLPMLVERATARDPAAACRLAFAVNRCVEEVRRRETTRRLTASLEQRGSDNEDMLVGAIASSDVRNELSGGYCEGVDVETLPDAEALLEAAAPGFTPRQKTLLALMRSDGAIRRLQPSQGTFFEPGLYAMPQFQADHGYQFLLDGFAARDPLALEGLVLTHAPGNAIPVQGVHIALPNPRLYVRYASLYRALFGDHALGFAGLEMLRSAAARLTPQALTQIDQGVQIETEQWRSALATQAVRPAPADREAAKEAEDRMASCEE